MRIKIDGTVYEIGRRKGTNKYCIWWLDEVLKMWRFSMESEHFADISKEIKRLRKNAADRERRRIIAELCGTSARAACTDMGLKY